MKVSSLVCGLCCLAGLAVGQAVDGVVREAPGLEAVFIGPPTVSVPAMTSEVVVFEDVVTTNVVTTFTTNRVARREVVVTTNATLRRFVVDIDADQVPTRFTSYMSDGSVVVTAAGDVGSLTNRASLSTFNGLLQDVIGNGRRNVNTNVLWQARGTNGAARMQRVWSAASARP